ncbi:MAG: hypothetical protein ACXWXQ_06225 [Actinomycetota bacterium]
MPASVTVWCVEIGADALPEDVKGSLALTSDALVFTPRADRPERRYPLREIAQARRLRGSPVLMVARETPEGLRRTAFYFVQPPPLDRPDIPARPSPMGLGRNTTRKARRQNVSYLGMWNREKKALLREWERQVKRAVAAARP